MSTLVCVLVCTHLHAICSDYEANMYERQDSYTIIQNGITSYCYIYSPAHTTIPTRGLKIITQIIYKKCLDPLQSIPKFWYLVTWEYIFFNITSPRGKWLDVMYYLCMKSVTRYLKVLQFVTLKPNNTLAQFWSKRNDWKKQFVF